MALNKLLIFKLIDEVSISKEEIISNPLSKIFSINEIVSVSIS